MSAALLMQSFILQNVFISHRADAFIFPHASGCSKSDFSAASTIDLVHTGQ